MRPACNCLLGKYGTPCKVLGFWDSRFNLISQTSSSVAPDRQCICTLCTYQRRGWLEMKCGILLTFSLTLVQCQREYSFVFLRYICKSSPSGPGPGPHGPARRRPRPEQNNRDEIEPTCPSSISGRVSSGVFCPNEDGTISCRGRKDCPKDLSLRDGEDVKYDCREGVCSEISSTCKGKRRGNACKPVFLAIPLDFSTGHAGQSFT